MGHKTQENAHPLPLFPALVQRDGRDFESGQSVAAVPLPSVRERLVVVDGVRLLRLEPLGEQPQLILVRTRNCDDHF